METQQTNLGPDLVTYYYMLTEELVVSSKVQATCCPLMKPVSELRHLMLASSAAWPVFLDAFLSYVPRSTFFKCF